MCSVLVTCKNYVGEHRVMQNLDQGSRVRQKWGEPEIQHRSLDSCLHVLQASLMFL